MRDFSKAVSIVLGPFCQTERESEKEKREKEREKERMEKEA